MKMQIYKRAIVKFLILLFVFIFCCAPIVISQRIKASTRNPTNAVTKLNRKNDLIFLNTIDGKMHAIGKFDGKIKWSIQEDSVINLSKNNENPYFLTDPRDGSLYIFTSREDGGLKKFPYTIAELVSSSPSKSKDGFLYTGDKKDQWLAVDYRNGYKLDTLTAETLSSKISIADENVVFIGRTQYTVSMFDIASRKKVFNLTYYDYSTHSDMTRPLTPSANINSDPRNYPFYHFTSNSDGTLVTLDKKNGDLIWKLKLQYPVIAMYRYEDDHLFKISFSVFATEALTSITNQVNAYKQLYNYQQLEEKSLLGNDSGKPTKSTISHIKEKEEVFKSTLYVGFYEHNLYALPSLVYNSKTNLIEGPVPNRNNDQHQIIPFPIKMNENETKIIEVKEKNKQDSGIIGHHKLPENFDPPSDYMQPNNNLFVITNNKETELIKKLNLEDLFSGNMNKQEQCLVATSNKISFIDQLDELLQNKYIWSLFTVFIASLFPLLKTIYDYRRKKARQLLKQLTAQKQQMISSEEETDSDTFEEELSLKKSSQGSKKSRVSSQNSSETSKLHESHSLPIILNDDLLRIGKITYNTREVLGHGCSGTFVYKGTFENRPVAVKRLLPECWTLADREVELLRDADQHQNVLRYFCTEADSQFRYIALELCQMTLNDYVKNIAESHRKQNAWTNNKTVPIKPQLDPLNILEQATRGLDHLHSLDIVHRDIKPQNVLISFPDQKGKTNVMISDFGLCKRLEMGIKSFSNRSGVTGTDGWIAAELIADLYNINPQGDESSAERKEMEESFQQIRRRVTKSVDIFSLGCVYYYVLSLGNHPFGDSIMRQINILNNDYKLDKLVSVAFAELHVQKLLIDKMVSKEPAKRPLTKELLSHPIFWTNSKTLQFLQDVSDRIETLDQNDSIIMNLEKNANVILKNNWKTHICSALSSDLNKFRKYNGVSTRDLLRAIRNKKHHYRELPDNVKSSLGNIPDEFVKYFTFRFPKLIMHVYQVMQCCQFETIFQVYYSTRSH